MRMAKKRAVAYVRVSSGSDAQLHSFDFQAEYWTTTLGEEPGVELVGIYADKGISGRSAGKRPQFQLMMQDARAGLFDVIYTKSTSRFARNTVDLLNAVRELRDLGVEVVFQNENISTLQPTSEVYLTIAAALAENELQDDSDRQRWSYQDRFKNGWISIGKRMYGYKMTADNQVEVIEEEAAVVRRIFDLYIAGNGAVKICKILNADGLKNSYGNPWQHNNILEIISNEKYTGNALMGKHVRINGVHMRNDQGQRSQRYYIENTHEAIISQEAFDEAQQVRDSRKNAKMVGRTQPRHEFTGMIECGCCGKHFNRKMNATGLKWSAPVWTCYTQTKFTVAACDNSRIKENVLHEKFIEAYNRFIKERPTGETVSNLVNRVRTLEAEEHELAALALQHMITEAAFHKEQLRIKAEVTKLNDEIADQRNRSIGEEDLTPITEYDPEKVKKFITKVIVYRNTITFVLYNGAEIKLDYSNGQPGNKPGWNGKEAK